MQAPKWLVTAGLVAWSVILLVAILAFCGPFILIMPLFLWFWEPIRRRFEKKREEARRNRQAAIEQQLVLERATRARELIERIPELYRDDPEMRRKMLAGAWVSLIVAPLVFRKSIEAFRPPELTVRHYRDQEGASAEFELCPGLKIWSSLYGFKEIENIPHSIRIIHSGSWLDRREEVWQLKW